MSKSNDVLNKMKNIYPNISNSELNIARVALQLFEKNTAKLSDNDEDMIHLNNCWIRKNHPELYSTCGGHHG